MPFVAACFLAAGMYLSPQIIEDLPVSTSTIDDIIDLEALQWGASSSTMRYIVRHESGYEQFAENKTAKEDSLGLIQINLRAHPEVTREDAFSPLFELKYLAQHLAAGECYMWSTCPY